MGLHKTVRFLLVHRISCSKGNQGQNQSTWTNGVEKPQHSYLVESLRLSEQLWGWLQKQPEAQGGQLELHDQICQMLKGVQGLNRGPPVWLQRSFWIRTTIFYNPWVYNSEEQLTSSSIVVLLHCLLCLIEKKNFFLFFLLFLYGELAQPNQYIHPFKLY